MSASLAEGREHGGHVLPSPLNTRELRLHSPGDVLARPRANAPQWTIAFNTGLPFDLHANSAG